MIQLISIAVENPGEKKSEFVNGEAHALTLIPKPFGCNQYVIIKQAKEVSSCLVTDLINK